MKTITSSADLKAAIRELELEQKNNFTALKEELTRVQDNLKLTSIIKNNLKKMVAAPDLKAGIINTAIGLVSGIMTKKLVAGKTHSPFSKLAAMAMEMVVANKVTKNADLIRSAGGIILDKIFRKKQVSENVF